MKIIAFSILTIFLIGCNVVIKEKKTSLEILAIPSVELDYPDKVYNDILKESFPEKKLMDIFLKIPRMFNDIQGSWSLNYHINASLLALFMYSKKHKISNEFVPILIDLLDRHWYTFENTLINAKLICKITNIDVGWDEAYVKNWTGSEINEKDRKEKIAKWKKWVVDNKVRDMTLCPLLSANQENDSITLEALLKLEDSKQLIQAYSNLAYDEDAEKKLLSIIIWLYSEEPNAKGNLHLSYALEALNLYSQDQPISISTGIFLIKYIKSYARTFLEKNSCAKLLKSITKEDFGWEYNYYNYKKNIGKNTKDREEQIKKWEDWFNKSR